MKTQSIVCGALCLCALHSHAAVPLDFVVDLKATVSDTSPHIVLSWKQRAQVQSNIIAQKIHRRLKGATTWTKLADLTTTQTGYTDTTATTGIEYEYWMERVFSGLSPSKAVGYLSAGVKVPEVHDRGTLLLVIDDTMIAPLAQEISQLKQDLVADGWTVRTIPAPRAGTAASTKALISTAYNADPSSVNCVYLLGHIPVPYSGNLAPDAHPDHVGAWPADAYYGEMNGNWTDSSITNTEATGTRNDNVVGDGKFDQSSIPTTVELEVGRVDLHTLTKGTNAGVSEISLLRRYLKKAHDFRHKQGAYTSIPRRSLIRDGFGHLGNSEPFAVNGWAGAYANVGETIDQAPSGQWFSTTYAGGKDYLFGYGCGSGSQESASTFGTTTDLGYRPSRVVFMSLFGSYHGDWDGNNNLMRAVLAGNGYGNSLGLTCFWGGRPHWVQHTPGMGETMGHAARLTMNATGSTGSYEPRGYSAREVHIGLLGDPALRMHMVEPPRNLSGSSTSGLVTLNWNPAVETPVEGYHVYRSDSPDGPFVKLTTVPQTTNSFADPTGTPGTKHTYLVRTLKLETVPGGSYYNLSIGSPVEVMVSSGPDALPATPGNLSLNTSTGSAQLNWSDNATGETGYRIERKTNASGTFESLAILPSNATSYTDAGPFALGGVYHYRIVTTGTAGDSAPTPVESFEAFAGLLEFTATRMKVNKSAGTATVNVARIGGSAGEVGVTCTTSNVSATAGTHYGSTTTTLSWASGDTTAKSLVIPITDTASPQLPRQFKVTLSSATGSATISAASVIAVQIEDPSATLASPWISGLIGTSTEHSPAVSAEGVIGDATLGGDGAEAGDTSEAGRFIHQSRSGNGVIVAQIPTPIVNQTGARFGLMVRASTATNAIMAATMVGSSNANFGSKFTYRAGAGSAVVASPSTDNNLDTPRWLRLTRHGNDFISEVSPDGNTWTLLGNITLTSMPSNALWGVFHYSSAPNSTTGIGDYHLATYQNLSLNNLPAPSAPTSFTATPGATEISLVWTDTTHIETAFEIQRQPANGSWTPLQSLAANSASFTDTNLVAGVLYNYRIRTTSAAGVSSWVETSATSPGGPVGYRQWLLSNNLPMDESGSGSATAMPSSDQLPNLVKYSLGLPVAPPGHGGRLASSIETIASANHLTFTYVHPEPPPADVSYAVEASPDMADATWSTASIVPVSSTVDTGLRTVIVRLNVPADSGKHFMRLKISRP